MSGQLITASMLDNIAASQAHHAMFVQRIRSFSHVWGLRSADGWCVSSSTATDEQKQVMPFWSNRAYAAQCAKENWAAYEPAVIPLQEFMDAWLPGMASDGVLVGTNWNVHLIGSEVEPLSLKRELATGA